MRNLYTIDSISYNIQDIWKLAELDRDSIDDEKYSAVIDLRDDIPKAFRNSKLFKPLFKNKKEWQWKIYSYDTTQVSVEIENDDDLQGEIDAFMPSAGDESANDDDMINENRYLKLRVVFSKGMNVCLVIY